MRASSDNLFGTECTPQTGAACVCAWWIRVAGTGEARWVWYGRSRDVESEGDSSRALLELEGFGTDSRDVETGQTA